MAQTVIIQRVVPHYRVPLLRRLHEEYGWIVATSRVPPPDTGLRLEQDHPFIRTFDFRFPVPGRPQRCLVPVASILRDLKPRAVIAEFALGMSSTHELAARRRFLCSPKLIYWGYGFNPNIGIETRSQRMKNLPLVGLMSAADGAITYSEQGRAFLQSYLPRKPIFVARNTMDLEEKQRLARTLKPADIPGWPRLISVNRFTPAKRLDELVRVFLDFRRVYPGASLTIIGEGPERARIEEAAGMAIGESVFLTGEIYDEREIARRFMACDAFVAAGGVGLSGNHAMAYGLPVICFDTGDGAPRHGAEVAYVVDGLTGRRVRPFTREAMAAALAEFFSAHKNPRADFAAGIARMLKEKLDLSNMVRDFGQVDQFLESGRHA